MRFAPMLRSVDLILLVALIATVSWTFKVKHDSQQALERVAELEKQIAAEKVEIDLLKSDWSLLTSPARLQQLVEKYSRQLELDAMRASQIANDKELPAFRAPNPPETPDTFAETDVTTTTGSISGDAQ